MTTAALRFALLVALVPTAATCRATPAHAPNDAKTRTTMSTPTTTEQRLNENIPARVSDRKVVAYNIWERDYSRADGSNASGAAAVLSVSGDGKVDEAIVGAGSRVTIGADSWDVVTVDGGKSTPDRGGHVVLRRVGH